MEVLDPLLNDARSWLLYDGVNHGYNVNIPNSVDGYQVDGG